MQYFAFILLRIHIQLNTKRIFSGNIIIHGTADVEKIQASTLSFSV
jgi:hypothetical protein